MLNVCMLLRVHVFLIRCDCLRLHCYATHTNKKKAMFGLASLCIHGIDICMLKLSVKYEKCAMAAEDQKCFPYVCKRTLIFMAFFVAIMLIGSYTLMKYEGWEFIDALYFMWVSVSTIGFGLFPLFFFVCICVCVFFCFFFVFLVLYDCL